MLQLVEYYGAVDTTWIVYGAHKRFKGQVIAQSVPWLYAAESVEAPALPSHA